MRANRKKQIILAILCLAVMLSGCIDSLTTLEIENAWTEALVEGGVDYKNFCDPAKQAIYSLRSDDMGDVLSAKDINLIKKALSYTDATAMETDAILNAIMEDTFIVAGITEAYSNAETIDYAVKTYCDKCYENKKVVKSGKISIKLSTKASSGKVKYNGKTSDLKRFLNKYLHPEARNGYCEIEINDYNSPVSVVWSAEKIKKTKNDEITSSWNIIEICEGKTITGKYPSSFWVSNTLTEKTIAKTSLASSLGDYQATMIKSEDMGALQVTLTDIYKADIDNSINLYELGVEEANKKIIEGIGDKFVIDNGTDSVISSGDDNFTPNNQFALATLDGSYDSFEIKTISKGSYVGQGDKIWGTYKNYSDNISQHIVQFDVNGNIYRDIAFGSGDKIKLALNETDMVIESEYSSGYKDKRYSFDIRNIDTNDSVKERYLGEYEDIAFIGYDEISGVNILLYRKEETYNSKKMIFSVVDETGNEKFNFTSDEIAERCGVDWKIFYIEKIRDCGSGIYYIKIAQNINSESACFVDTRRKKAYAVKHAPYDSNWYITSDGNYIYCDGHGRLILNCETEQEVNFRSEKYRPSTEYAKTGVAFSNGYIYGIASDMWSDDKAILDINGNTITELNFENTNVTSISQIQNGCAIVRFNSKFVTIVNPQGEFMFEPIEGSIYGCYNIEGKNVYIIDANSKLCVLYEDGSLKEITDDVGANIFFTNIGGKLYAVSVDYHGKLQSVEI